MTKQIKYFIGLTLLLAAVSASAQSTQAIEVKVPFPFVTAGKSWPAADYKVQVRPEVGILTLSSPGILPASMLTTHDDRSGGGQPYMRFECSGDHWVLQQVTLEGTTLFVSSGKPKKGLADLNPSCQETVAASGPDGQ